MFVIAWSSSGRPGDLAPARAEDLIERDLAHPACQILGRGGFFVFGRLGTRRALPLQAARNKKVCQAADKLVIAALQIHNPLKMSRWRGLIMLAGAGGGGGGQYGLQSGNLGRSLAAVLAASRKSVAIPPPSWILPEK